jgi:hypothetical protein
MGIYADLEQNQAESLEVVDLPATHLAKVESPQSWNPVIVRGQTALSELDRDTEQRQEWGNWRWGQWELVCLAVAEVQTLAMRKAQTNKPFGPKYRKAIKPILGATGFDRYSSPERSRMRAVASKIIAINAWRSNQSSERQLVLNHPDVVLAAYNRSLRQARPKKEPTHPLLAGWNRSKAPSEQCTTADLREIGFPEVRRYMPPEWYPEIADIAARVQMEDGVLDRRMTGYLQKAIEHIEIAESSKTSEPVKQGHKVEALKLLHEILEALRGIKRLPRELHIRLTKTPNRKPQD